MRHRLVSSLAVGVSLLAGASSAHAKDPARAEALFREGRALIVAERYPEACAKFDQSLRLDHAPGTLLNLADCEERVHRVAAAWAHYSELSRELPATDERQSFAKDRAEALEGRLPLLTVDPPSASGPDARLTRDGVELAPTAFGVPVPLDPGPHTVLVREGEDVYRAEVQLTEGESKTLDAGSLRSDTGGARSPSTRTAGWITGAFGVVALGAGSAFGIAALTTNSAVSSACSGGVCEDATSARSYDEARTQARIADVTLGIGVVSSVIAGYLLWVSSRRPEGAPVALAIGSVLTGGVAW